MGFLLELDIILLGGRRGFRRGSYRPRYYRQPAKRKRQSRRVLAQPRLQQQRYWKNHP